MRLKKTLRHDKPKAFNDDDGFKKRMGALPHHNFLLHYHVPINLQKLFWIETLRKIRLISIVPKPTKIVIVVIVIVVVKNIRS